MKFKTHSDPLTVSNPLKSFSFESIERTLRRVYLVFRPYSNVHPFGPTVANQAANERRIKINIAIIIFQVIQAVRCYALFFMSPGSDAAILLGDIFFTNGKAARNAIHFGFACVIAQGSLLNRLGILLVEKKEPLKMLKDLNDLICQTKRESLSAVHFFDKETRANVNEGESLNEMRKHTIISYLVHEKLATAMVVGFVALMIVTFAQCVDNILNVKGANGALDALKITSLSVFFILNVVSTYISGKDILIVFNIWDSALRLVELKTDLLADSFALERDKVAKEIESISIAGQEDGFNLAPINFLQVYNSLHKLVHRYLKLQETIRHYNLVSARLLLGITSLAIPVPCSGFFVAFFQSFDSQLAQSMIISNAVQTAVVIFVQTRRVTCLYTRSIHLYRTLTSFAAVLSTVSCRNPSYQESYSILAKSRLKQLIQSVGCIHKPMSFTDTTGIAYTPLSQMSTIGSSVAFFMLYSNFLKDW